MRRKAISATAAPIAKSEALTDIMTTVSTHTCELCRAPYADLAVAQACEAQGIPPTPFAVGDYVVGGNTYGWWGPDRSWVLTSPRSPTRDGLHGPGTCHGPGKGYTGEWSQDAGDGTPTGPGHRWFKVLYRIVAIQTAEVAGYEARADRAVPHRLMFILWNPRHPNRVNGTEHLARTYDRGHATPGDPAALLPAGFVPPVLSDHEAARFAELCAVAYWRDRDAGLV